MRSAIFTSSGLGEAAEVRTVLKAAAIIDKRHEGWLETWADFDRRKEEAYQRSETALQRELHKLAKTLKPGAKLWPPPYDPKQDRYTYDAK